MKMLPIGLLLYTKSALMTSTRPVFPLCLLRLRYCCRCAICQCPSNRNFLGGKWELSLCYCKWKYKGTFIEGAGTTLIGRHSAGHVTLRCVRNASLVAKHSGWKYRNSHQRNRKAEISNLVVAYGISPHDQAKKVKRT
jgi:hypothetical protein